MNRKCKYCGAKLHDQSSFCPYCFKSINERLTLKVPHCLRIRYLKFGLAGVILICLIIGICFISAPQEYDSGTNGYVYYKDGDGEYQVLVSFSADRYEPVVERVLQVEADGEYRLPARLYINHKATGVNASGMFLQKVSHIEVQFVCKDSGGDPVTATEPQPDDYAPEAAMVTYVDFTGKSKDGELIWTIHMENGDKIKLRQTIRFEQVKTYNYSYEDVDIRTVESLQAFLEEIQDQIEEKAVINIYLAPVVYDGNLVIEGRSVNIYGSSSGNSRTTFNGTIFVTLDNSAITYINDVDFAGPKDGTGTGVSTMSRVHLTGCRISGFKTGVLAYGESWVNLTECTLENNNVGFHFNSVGDTVTHTQYTDNNFVNNNTAVLLENVPTEIEIHFDGCIFSGNGIDIDNRCNHALDLTGAIFE